MALDRALLERMEQLLREGTTDGYPNLTKPELRELAATARALTASAEAEIEARPMAFPAELRPALVMQWLPLREVAAPLRVASSWCRDSEQYFRRFAQHHGLIRGDLWQDSVRCYMEWYRYGGFSDFQQEVFASYAKFWAKGDTRFKSIDEVAAAWRDDKHKYSYPPRRAYADAYGESLGERFRCSLVSLVCFGKLNASPTGGGHRFKFQVEGLDDLTPLQLRVLKYHISGGVQLIHKSAADLGIDLDQLRTTVDFLVSAGHLSSLIDEDDKYFMATGRSLNGFKIGLTPFQQRILVYYKECATSDEGLDINDLAELVDLPELRIGVRSSVDFLASEGYLYPTIDDDHHKAIFAE